MVLLATVMFGLTACGGEDSRGDKGRSVAVFATGASPGLRASLDVFEATRGIRVRLTGTSGFAGRLEGRVDEGNPPDIALFPQPGLMAEFARAGDLVPLSENVVEVVEENYSPGVLQLGNVDDELFGVLLNANAKSLVWYRPDAFDAFGYDVPRTWDELTALTETMKADGFTPWCFGARALGVANGWPATDWIETLVLQMFGGEVYVGWLQGEIAFDDSRIEEAFELFEATTLATGQTFNGRRGILSTLWNHSGDPLLADPPGCFLNRVPSFWRSSLPEGTTVGLDGDIDFFPLPAIDAEIGTAMVIGGPVAAAFDDREDVMKLLEYLASPESGLPWAAAGGYVSPHRDFDPGAYGNPFDRRIAETIDAATLIGFDGSDIMPPAVGEGTFLAGMLHFIRTRDFAATVEIINAGFENSE